MKTICLILSIIMLDFCLLCAQTEEELVNQIRKQFQVINSEIKTYTTQSNVSTLEESGAEQTITAYFKGKVLMKIDEKFMGDMAETTNQYYFWDKELFFVFTTYTYYMPDGSGSVITENRYYFNKNKLIRWLDNEKMPMDKASDEFKEKEKTWLDNANRFKHEYVN